MEHLCQSGKKLPSSIVRQHRPPADIMEQRGSEILLIVRLDTVLKCTLSDVLSGKQEGSRQRLAFPCFIHFFCDWKAAFKDALSYPKSKEMEAGAIIISDNNH